MIRLPTGPLVALALSVSGCAADDAPATAPVPGRPAGEPDVPAAAAAAEGVAAGAAGEPAGGVAAEEVPADASLALAADAVTGVTEPWAPPWLQLSGRGGPGAGKRVVLVSGDEEYRSEEALPMLARLLAVRHGFDCTVLFATDPETGLIDPEQQTNIPGMHLLDDADLVVLFTRFRELPDADMAHLVDYVRSGRPLIGLRTATHAFSYTRDPDSSYADWDWRSASWPGGFGKQVLGETWVAHHGYHGVESTRGVAVPDQADHPILRGVSDIWGPTDVYAVRALPDDAVVLVEGAVLEGMDPSDAPVAGPKNDPRTPLIWIREGVAVPGGRTGRVLASTIGAATDFASEGLRRLLVNACYWGVGLEDAIPERADADTVGEYEPTAFGFGGYVKGRRPSDFALEPR